MWEVTQVSKADAKRNFPFALVLKPFSLFLPPRPAWHENCEAEILACISPHLGKRSACLLQAGVRVTRHESWPFIGLPWARKSGATRIRRPDCLAAQPLLSCALWGGYGAAMERHERQIAPEPLSAHVAPFTVRPFDGGRSPQLPSPFRNSSRNTPKAWNCGRRATPCSPLRSS